MILDTGYRCHELSRLDLLPFAIATDVDLLYNQSGHSGPVIAIPENNPAISGFSGVLGPGTAYPVSGTLDQVVRQFWAVKSWNLTITMSRVMDDRWEDCPIVLYDPFLPFPPSFRFFNSCSIGAYAGNYGQIPPPMIIASKSLTLQDYCSNQSTGYNLDRRNICPYSDFSGVTPNSQTCCAINPAQKFNDLLCRKSYASWMPTDEDWNTFATGNLRDLRFNPYVSKTFQFRVYSNPELITMYRCSDTVYFEDVYSMFSLSIMDNHNFTNSQSCNIPVSGYYPDIESGAYPFDCFGVSGESLISSYGDITGYGVNKKPSGIDIPLLFDVGTGVSEEFAPDEHDPKTYFPLINFKMRLRTNSTSVSDGNLCPVNDSISSIRTRRSQSRVGQLVIRDFVTGAGSTLDSDLAIMEIPLFATTTTRPATFSVDAVLQPSDFWVYSDLREKY